MELKELPGEPITAEQQHATQEAATAALLAAQQHWPAGVVSVVCVVALQDGDAEVCPCAVVTCDDSERAIEQARRAVEKLRGELPIPDRYRSSPVHDVLAELAIAITHAPQPRGEWNEGWGNVLWWRFPVTEPPYVGTPLDDDFPDYVTHWTQLPVPFDPPTEGS